MWHFAWKTTKTVNKIVLNWLFFSCCSCSPHIFVCNLFVSLVFPRANDSLKCAKFKHKSSLQHIWHTVSCAAHPPRAPCETFDRLRWAVCTLAVCSCLLIWERLTVTSDAITVQYLLCFSRMTKVSWRQLF